MVFTHDQDFLPKALITTYTIFWGLFFPSPVRNISLSLCPFSRSTVKNSDLPVSGLFARFQFVNRIVNVNPRNSNLLQKATSGHTFVSLYFRQPNHSSSAAKWMMGWPNTHINNHSFSGLLRGKDDKAS